MSKTENLINKSVTALDKGCVTLLDVMPHPESGVSPDLAIVNAARTSYLGESKGEEKDKRLLFYLMEHGHNSPFEQVELKFLIKAPVVCWWQISRHRTFSMNLQSGRYTPFQENEFYLPSEWRLQSKDNKQGSEGLADKKVSSMLTSLLEDAYSLGYETYQTALDCGIAKEQARLFLPAFGLYYTGVVKCDVHNWMNFLKQRTDNHAQYEIRMFANVIYNEFFKPLLPWTSEAFEKYRLNKSF